MKSIAKENLLQLKGLLTRMQLDDYNKKTEVLSEATIGQHIRHIVEFYLLLISGSFSDTICYDQRKRSVQIEKDPSFAIQTIERILPGIDTLILENPVMLRADFTSEGTSVEFMNSSVGRELSYCLEHSIHHQAIIKAGLIAMGLKDLTDESFGLAYSTQRYRNDSCAQ